MGLCELDHWEQLVGEPAPLLEDALTHFGFGWVWMFLDGEGDMQ